LRKVQGPPHLNPLPPGERKEKKMGEGQDEGENLGCRSKIDALRQRLRKAQEPPHLNPLPPGERKERK